MQTIIPSGARVIDIARQASAQNMRIITDGDRTILSHLIPPGWYEITVKIKHQASA